MNAPLRRPRDSKGRFIADGVAVNDSFQNLLARTGDGAGSLMDGAGYTQSNLLTRRPRELEFMYRGSWIVGATVDAIADDMCRAGIDFSAAVSPEAAQDMQGVTDDLQIWSELADTIRWGRLYGGAIGVILIDGQDLATPLRLETVRRDSFQGIIPLSRWELWPQLDQSLIGNGRIGRPEFYQVGQSATWLQDRKVHNTRVIRMEGVRLPYFQRIAEQGWGMSVIERLFDRLIAYDSTSTGAAQLVYKAYLRTLKVEGLREILSAGGPAEAALRKNVDYIRQFQQNEGITLIDAKDEFEALTYSFAGLDDVLIQFGQQISGATGIPLVRLFGQSPAGLNATGDSDIRLYYDTIASQQRHMLRSPVNRIADILHRSVVGKAPDDGFGYTFNPLWQLREAEKADIALKTAQAVAAAYDDDIVDKATAMRELKQSGAVTGIFATIKEQAIRGEELKPPPLSEMAAFLGNPPGVILPPGLEKEAALITMRKAVAEIVPPIVRYSAPGPLPAVREMTEGVMERLAETPANDLGDIPARLAPLAVNDRRPTLVQRVRRFLSRDAGWKEDDHPRAKDGKFGSGGGSPAAKTKTSEHIERAEHHHGEAMRELASVDRYRNAGQHGEAEAALGRHTEHSALAKHHETKAREWEAAGGEAGHAERINAMRQRVEALGPPTAQSAIQASQAPAPAFYSPQETEGLPKKARQPRATWAGLREMAPAALEEYSHRLNGIARKLNLKTGARPEVLNDRANVDSPDGYLFVGPLKSYDRAAQKVVEYDGDWSQLTDVVRATIAVKTFDELKAAVSECKAAGLHIAQKPKDKFAEPTAEGYRDLNCIVTLPGGMRAELQFHVKEMTAAKEVAHPDYEISRDLQAKYGEDAPTDKWSDEDHRVFHEAVSRQREVYGMAWERVTGERS